MLARVHIHMPWCTLDRLLFFNTPPYFVIIWEIFNRKRKEKRKRLTPSRGMCWGDPGEHRRYSINIMYSHTAVCVWAGMSVICKTTSFIQFAYILHQFITTLVVPSTCCVPDCWQSLITWHVAWVIAPPFQLSSTKFPVLNVPSWGMCIAIMAKEWLLISNLVYIMHGSLMNRRLGQVHTLKLTETTHDWHQ